MGRRVLKRKNTQSCGREHWKWVSGVETMRDVVCQEVVRGRVTPDPFPTLRKGQLGTRSQHTFPLYPLFSSTCASFLLHCLRLPNSPSPLPGQHPGPSLAPLFSHGQSEWPPLTFPACLNLQPCSRALPLLRGHLEAVQGCVTVVLSGEPTLGNWQVAPRAGVSWKRAGW